MDNYRFAILKPAQTGIYTVYGSASTVYRWARRINEILEKEGLGWRVRAEAKRGVLRIVSEKER